MIVDPPVLQATPAFGTDGADRFVIQNLKNRHVWTGDDFSPEWKNALLYASVNRACGDMRRIMMRVYEGELLTIYETPCRIEVFGYAPMIHVQKWLSRAALLKLRTDDFGNGPNDSLVIPSIHWSEMEQVDEK